MGKGDQAARKRPAPSGIAQKEILFSTTNYIIIGIGLLLVIVGFFVMSGGHNGPDEWKAEVIYSFSRLTLAPIIILTGLGVVVVAIFKDSKEERTAIFKEETE